MSNIFARLEELSTQLNASSDALSESVKRVEAKLASLRLGVSVWLEKPLETSSFSNASSQGVIPTRFGYSKVNGTWCLAIHEDMFELTGDPDDSPLVPLQQASREHRIKALQRIPELIKELEAAAESQLKNVQTVVASAETL